MTRHTTPDSDPRERPAYPLIEAAHYLSMPTATLRAWCLGQPSVRNGKRRMFHAVIDVADKEHCVLSFMNLVEAYVLDGLRRVHQVPLQKIRRALTYLASERPSPHPLANLPLETDGWHLFLEEYGRLIEISSQGQMALRDVLQSYLTRVDRDAMGKALRLYPFTRRREADEPKAVVIDPFVAFGRPSLHGTGIPTAMIASRLKAGETIEEIAADYGKDSRDIEEAIRCELAAA